MCLAFCTLYVERGATPALHLMGGGLGGLGEGVGLGGGGVGGWLGGGGGVRESRTSSGFNTRTM